VREAHVVDRQRRVVRQRGLGDELRSLAAESGHCGTKRGAGKAACSGWVRMRRLTCCCGPRRRLGTGRREVGGSRLQAGAASAAPSAPERLTRSLRPASSRQAHCWLARAARRVFKRAHILTSARSILWHKARWRAARARPRIQQRVGQLEHATHGERGMLLGCSSQARTLPRAGLTRCTRLLQRAAMSEAPAAAAADVAPSTPLGPAFAARAAARAGGARSSPAAEAVAPSPYTPHAGASAAEDETLGAADAGTQGSAEAAEPSTPGYSGEDEDDDDGDDDDDDADDVGPVAAETGLLLTVKDELRPLVEELEAVHESLLAWCESKREPPARAPDDMRVEHASRMGKLGIDVKALQDRPNYTAQVSALLATLHGLLFDGEPRGRVVMPCGTGKSYVMLLVVAALHCFTDAADIIILAPSIHLVEQMKENALKYCLANGEALSARFRIEAVCSASEKKRFCA
jgi:hypothetical protein